MEISCRVCFCDVTVPYYCASDKGVSLGLGRCLQEPDEINVTMLIDQTMKYATSGMIDQTSNMLNDRVYIFHSEIDHRVLQGQYTAFLYRATLH